MREALRFVGSLLMALFFGAVVVAWIISVLCF